MTPPSTPVPSAPRRAVDALLAAPAARWRRVSWRLGTKGRLSARFAALRVCAADGPANAENQHLPGEVVWLVGEERAGGERKYYLTNHPAGTPLRTLAAAIKARWVCEQAHQQLKEELGLDYFEGRSWPGLHHHALLTQIAFAFLQHLRLRELKARRAQRGGEKTGGTLARSAARAGAADRAAPAPRAPRAAPRPLSALSPSHPARAA